MRPLQSADDIGLASAMGTAVAVATSATVTLLLTGALAVQMRDDIGFNELGLGTGVAAFFLVSAFVSVPGGRLAEILGPTKGMIAATLFGAASLLGMAALATNLVTMVVFLMVAGVANALGQPATSLFLARVVSIEHRGLAFGAKQAAIPLGTLLGGFSVPLIALTIGWRWAFAGAGVLALVTAMIAIPRIAVPTAPVMVRRRRPVDDMPLRPLILMAMGGMFGAAAVGGLAPFLVTTGVEAGLSPGSAGLLATASALCGVIARVAVGAQADRRGSRHFSTIVKMQSLGCLAFLALATGWVPGVIIGGLAGYGVAWGWAGLFHFAVVHSNPGAPGTAAGIAQVGTFTGGVIGPVTFGFLAEYVSYVAAWCFSAVLILLAALTITLGRNSFRLTMKARRQATEPRGI